MTVDLVEYFDAYARDYQPYKGGSWCYEDGCLYAGLIALHEATGDTRWSAHLKRLVDGQLDDQGQMRDYVLTEYNIDNILPGRALIFLLKTTGDDRYRVAADRLARQLQSHPRLGAGPYWHKLRYPHQVWLDGLYMGLAFKAEYGKLAGEESMVRDALEELLVTLELTSDGVSGLYRHGYDEERLQAWADPQTGLSPAHWARAIGWLAMAMVDLYGLAPEGADKSMLAEKLGELLTRLSHLRTGDGRWLQVIDQPDLTGNYPESSSTAMFAYASLKAARLGIAAAKAEIGAEALESLRRYALGPNVFGRIVMKQICCVAGLGGFGGVYRDGTPDYYLSEALNDDDIKGVGPLMMAEAERLRCATHSASPALV
ncbi:glycoside hydrolase family 88/105 protein [Agrobacterium vitis]|uniref:glycoside hydrolase family 88/105 protein n=1 Tax=Agrobacterium vitis TaxID=373 RepID=UPI0015D98B66|nr:glycoside hydrolase family 88 protein [Agrobacterium vitis]